MRFTSLFPTRAAGLALALASSVVLATAGQVAAAFPIEQIGQLGPFSFVDSQAESSVTCTYATWRVLPGVHKVKLDRIDVRPPIVKGITDGQQVSWRFIVYRHPSSDASLTGGNWKITYRSPIEKKVATTTVPAVFTPKGVSVSLPAGSREHDSAYEVVVKITWYLPGGGVQGSGKFVLSYYDKIVENQLLQRWPNWCAGRQWWAF